MPELTIRGAGTFDVEAGRRLAGAIEACGVDIGHRCGGKARCTTCRVRFEAGEPKVMTRAEHAKLAERDLRGEFRLSCQIVVDADMAVEVGMHTAEMGWSDPGPALAATVEPDAAWYPIADLDADASSDPADA